MEGLPLFGNKFPRVFSGRKRELQHAISVPFTDFAVRSGKAEEVMAASSSPGDNFPDSIHGIGFALGVLRRKTFVGVLVSRKNQVGMRGIQVTPELLQFGMEGVFLEDTAAKERVMAICQNASVGMFRKILFQPSLLR